MNLINRFLESMLIYTTKWPTCQEIYSQFRYYITAGLSQNIKKKNAEPVLARRFGSQNVQA